MTQQAINMTDNELLDELAKYCPVDSENVLREDFAASINRYKYLLKSIPDGGNSGSILDIGARLYTASLFCNNLNYKKVSLITKWKTDFTGEDILRTIANNERIDISYLDAEKDVFPYPDDSYDIVICSEIIEHLAVDPMKMMAQINRVTRPNGVLVVTTPNVASFAAIKRLLDCKHPYSWSPYSSTCTDRHNREYTIDEMVKVFEATGFAVVSYKTFSEKQYSIKDRILAKYISLPDILRGKKGLDLSRLGQTSLVIGKKISGVRDRFPSWLYYGSAAEE